MTLLSLTISEFERLLKAFATLTLVFACVIFSIRWLVFDAPVVTAVWQGFTSSLSVSTIGFGFFSRKKWTSPRLSKLLGRPIVHGLWRGTLHTNYNAKDGKATLFASSRADHRVHSGPTGVAAPP